MCDVARSTSSQCRPQRSPKASEESSRSTTCSFAPVDVSARNVARSFSVGGKPVRSSVTRRSHGLVVTGRAKPTPYRKGQNVIRDVRSGRTVYLPPEAKDVPTLMADLVEWVNGWITSGTRPIPVVAALAHYRFATIHPYFDGNGRTARLLTNLILHRNDYGLNGLNSLEEYYAKNLDGYYAGLTAGKSHKASGRT